VQKIAGEAVASSEEAVIQGEQLHALAYHLEESVKGFNLDGSTEVPAPVAAAQPRRPLPPATPSASGAITRIMPRQRKSHTRSITKPGGGR
jgi:hypothetical protein